MRRYGRVAVGAALASSSCGQLRFAGGHGPGDKRKGTKWHTQYPEIIRERDMDMYHSFYPYLFDHGDKMSLYPKIPENPRDWQPGQLLSTYDAVREDKYDAFMRLREKFPEAYADTQAWENPPPFGEFNQNYSVRFGMIGVKAFSVNEYDELGNMMPLTAFWFPDNQIVQHGTKDKHGRDYVVVGATNVPVEFHKPYVTSYYKRQRVPVKHVAAMYRITPDAFAPEGTKLDVRHFKVGQEVDIKYQNTDYGFSGVMFRYGFDGGYVWLGDSRWQRRPGSMSSEGASRIYPGHRQAGQTGAKAETRYGAPIYRIDYKNSLIYLATRIDADIGTYVKFSDTINTMGKTTWNAHRGYPPFPTFVPPEGEDVSQMPTEDCQLVSMPLYHSFRDEHHVSAQISQSDIDDARSVKPSTHQAKRKGYNLQKYLEARKKHSKQVRQARKFKLKGRRELASVKQEEWRQKKKDKYKRTK